MNSIGTGQKEFSEKIQERLIVFFDAVLAIAITMMALDIHVPLIEGTSQINLNLLFHQITAYLISFVVIGLIWMWHTQFFAQNRGVLTKRDLVLHFILLFLITLFPMATSALSDHQGDLEIQMLYMILFLLMMCIFLLVLNRAQQQVVSRRHMLASLYGELSSQKGILSESQQQAYARWKWLESGELAEGDASVPEEFRPLMKALIQKRKMDYNRLVVELVLSMVVVTLGVISLMVSPFLCWVVLLGGAFASRWTIRHFFPAASAAGLDYGQLLDSIRSKH